MISEPDMWKLEQFHPHLKNPLFETEGHKHVFFFCFCFHFFFSIAADWDTEMRLTDKLLPLCPTDVHTWIPKHFK